MRLGLAFAFAASLAAAVVPARPASAEVVERIVAVVNDDIVLLSELRDRLQPYLAEIRAVPSAVEREARLAQAQREMLQAMVDEQLITQQARRSNVSVTAEEVDRAIQNVIRANRMDRDQFIQALAGQGMSYAQYTIDVRRQLLALKVLNARVRGRINITTEDVRDAYNQTVRQVRLTDSFEGAQVLVRVPADAGPREVATARARAQRALARVRAGEAFADVARTLSDDASTRADGGSLGRHVNGQLDPVLDDVFLSLEPGEVAPEVVRTSQGFHVLKLVTRDASQVQPFEAVRDGLYQQLVEREMARQQQLWIKELRRRAFLQMRLALSRSAP